MVTEDYVSYETAKLLKDKGFNETTTVLYAAGTVNESWYNDYRERWARFEHDEGTLLEPVQQNDYSVNGPTISAPTLQMTMKWLRMKHNIHINLDIHWLHFVNALGWMYTITKILENGVDYVCSNGDENDKTFYSSYEEACEAAIRYCLENLI